MSACHIFFDTLAKVSFSLFFSVCLSFSLLRLFATVRIASFHLDAFDLTRLFLN